jgi:hypothetical protein
VRNMSAFVIHAGALSGKAHIHYGDFLSKVLDFVPMITHDALRMMRRIVDVVKWTYDVDSYGGRCRAEALRGVLK